MRKRCSKCRQYKKYHLFNSCKDTVSKLASWCILCCRRYNKPKKVTKEQAKRNRLKYSYGLTPDELVVMLLKQKNKCKICNSKLVKGHIDHDHKTGMVRGVLCQRCNLLLGHAKDSKAVLRNAIKYLDDLS